MYKLIMWFAYKANKKEIHAKHRVVFFLKYWIQSVYVVLHKTSNFGILEIKIVMNMNFFKKS